MPVPLLVLQNVCKTFPLDGLQVKAVCGVTLTINQGELAAIIGPSGSGKSTLMHIIGCLDRPTEGRMLIGGKDVTRMSDDELALIRNKMIGFVFQSFNLLPRTTAISNVAMPLIYANIGEKVRHQKAVQSLTLVGLGDRLYHRSNQLSGGQQQRVAIARALINNPAIILADEPTGNLDTKAGKEIMSLLKKLNHEGHTVVIVTHDMEIARQTKRIIRLVDGKIVA